MICEIESNSKKWTDLLYAWGKEAEVISKNPQNWFQFNRNLLNSFSFSFVENSRATGITPFIRKWVLGGFSKEQNERINSCEQLVQTLKSKSDPFFNLLSARLQIAYIQRQQMKKIVHILTALILAVLGTLLSAVFITHRVIPNILIWVITGSYIIHKLYIYWDDKEEYQRSCVQINSNCTGAIKFFLESFSESTPLSANISSDSASESLFYTPQTSPKCSRSTSPLSLHENNELDYFSSP